MKAPLPSTRIAGSPRRRKLAVFTAASLALPLSALATPASAASGVDDSASTTPGHSVTIDVLANDGPTPPPSSGPFGNCSGQVTDPPQHAANPPTGDFCPTGTFGTGKNAPVYTPEPGFSGVDTFAYEAEADNGDIYGATVSVLVQYPSAPACTDTNVTPATTPTHPYNNADGSTSQVFAGATATATIPVGVSSIRIDACGAQGQQAAAPYGGAGGPGGRAQATVSGNNVNATRSFTVVPGTSDGAVGNGGPAGSATATAGIGGGYSAVFDQTGGGDIVFVVAGGGGGGGGGTSCYPGGAGGDGGGPTGEDGYFAVGTVCPGPQGTGGQGGSTASPPGGAGGLPDGENGSQFQGGAGGSTLDQPGGGGGGGYFGGGGGGSGVSAGGGGGGGSGFIDSGLTSGSQDPGLRSGDGVVVLTYNTPAAPAFVQGPDGTAQVGAPYSSQVTVTATPTATISVEPGSQLPPGLSLSNGPGANTATIAGTPTTPGTYTFTLRATNAVGSTTHDYTIRVFPADGSGGGGGGTTGATTSPSPSPSASPPTSTTPSPSSTATTRRRLTLTSSTPLIPAGSTGHLTATGEANEPFELRCYTRPSTTYVTARSGSFDAAGNPITFDLSLGRNTRCFIQYATNPAQGASPTVVINVRTVLSLSAVHTGVHTYVFQGRNLPRVAGQLITLYRVDSDGNEIRTANLRTDDTGVYRLTRTFTGVGTFQFRARTPQTLNNAAGVSNTITVHVV
ncbi:MAG: hypothetical protein QOI82_1671 [Actinomycetota bacterium]|nr:hypothetical protein [Actinomycetota bacterium]